MRYLVVPLVLGGMGLAGCNATGSPTDSSFATPDAVGEIGRVEVFSSIDGADSSAVTGNVYGYEVGSVANGGLQGFAGIASGAAVSAPPPGGTVVYTGTFEVAAVDFILVNGNTVTGQGYADAGEFTLTANFETGAVTGGGTGINTPFSVYHNGNVLSVDGQVSGDTLTGTATYDGVSGPMQGLVGSNEAIGVFHGHTDGQLHAGGFIAN